MIKSTNDVPVWELKGAFWKTVLGRLRVLTDDQGDRDAVVLEVDGKKLRVQVKDLEAAVKNAANSGRW